MDVNHWLDNLFKKSLEKGEPLVVCKICRSKKYISKEQLTLGGRLWNSFLNNTKKLVVENKSEKSFSGMQLGSYNSEQSNGFYLSNIEDFDPDWFRFLADHMVNRLKSEDYVLKKRFQEFSEHDNNQVCWEKTYLKPAIKFHNEKHCQGFGNIQLELKFINDEIKLFKLQANYYSGFNYYAPKAYSDLLAALFETRS